MENFVSLLNLNRWLSPLNLVEVTLNAATKDAVDVQLGHRATFRRPCEPWRELAGFLLPSALLPRHRVDHL